MAEISLLRLRIEKVSRIKIALPVNKNHYNQITTSLLKEHLPQAIIIASLALIISFLLILPISCLVIVLIMFFVGCWLSSRMDAPYQFSLLLNKKLEYAVIGHRCELRGLHNKNSEIQDSIEYVRIIQQNLLPSDSEMKRLLSDYLLISEPRDIIGGDFYWLRNHRGNLLLLLGDCTGHGLSGALMTTAINAMLNYIVDEQNIYDPALILSELDHLVKQYFCKEKQDKATHYGLDAGILYIEWGKKVLFSGAGIPLIVADAAVYEIKGQHNTIDCLNRKKSQNHAENLEIPYKHGIALYMPTDGMIEQPGGEKCLPYGKRRLMAAIEAVQHLEMKQQSEHILRSFKEYAASEMQRDDITLLGLRL